MAIDSSLTSLVHHMAWADARVWAAVLASDAARADARLLDTLHHMHLVQHLFRSGWAREGAAAPERAAFADASALARWGRDGIRQIADDVGVMEPDRVSAPFRVPWATEFESFVGRPAAPHTLGEAVLQVAMHTQHHRGQVCMRLREVGATPPYVDFIIWLWSGRPEADWGPVGE